MEKDKLEKAISFESPIYVTKKNEWVDEVTKVTKKYIKSSTLSESVYHSDDIYSDKKLKKFCKFILDKSDEILDEQGFDTKKYKLNFSEMWVQEYDGLGKAHHSIHTHSNTHISGFYFLKCSSNSSFPRFHDPRPGAMMTKLYEKDSNEFTIASQSVDLKCLPGTFVFFNSYLPHEFTRDVMGEPFIFIHFNVRADRK